MHAPWCRLRLVRVAGTVSSVAEPNVLKVAVSIVEDNGEGGCVTELAQDELDGPDVNGSQSSAEKLGRRV